MMDEMPGIWHLPEEEKALQILDLLGSALGAILAAILCLTVLVE